MEVSTRTVSARRRLTAQLGWLASSRALNRLALVATIAATVVIVTAQPLRSPWWTYADADATYTASSLNLLLGTQLKFVDHPGLPLEEIGAAAFGVHFLGDAIAGNSQTRAEFVDRLLLDLDETRPVFRSLAIAFYLAGTLLAFLLVRRLLGHWTWGLAASLLWLAAPGLAPMSIQFRPDVLLSVLVFSAACLIGIAVQTRSALTYASAAFVLGLAVMVKMHAAGLVPGLALAAVWRPPPPGWADQAARKVRAALRRRRIWILLVAAAWVTVAVATNWSRIPFDLNRELVLAAFLPPLLLGGYLGLALVAPRFGLRFLSRVFQPFYALVAAALYAGLAVPVTFDIPDGLRGLVNVAKGLTGGGINESIEPFSAPLDQLAHYPLRQAMFVFILAGAGAVIGLVRREPLPVALFVGAAILGVMGQARLAALHYFAPAFVVSIPAALWLLQRTRGRAASLLVWPVVAFVVVPQFEHREGARVDAEVFAESQVPALAFVRQRLQPGEVGLADSYWPDPDVRYSGLVEPYVSYTPEYPYRFLEASVLNLQIAQRRGLRPRYFVGRETGNVTGTAELNIGNIGVYTVRRVSNSPAVVELVSGPGVDEPLP